MISTELSADARAVANLLSSVSVGDLATFATISAAIGRDITTCRHVLAAGRKVAERESGAVFATERGKGLRRLSAERATETVGSAARAHIRTTARRASRTLVAATSRMNDLPPAVQRRLSAEISALSLVEHLVRDAAVRPVENGPLKPTPVAVTARAMMAALTGQKDEPGEAAA